MIYDICTVAERNLDDFAKSIGETVFAYQEQGLKVDIQYQPFVTGTRAVYSALIIVRREA